MFRFICKGFLFLLPLFLLLAIMEYQAQLIPSDYAVKREKLEQNLDRAEVIITGSSHAFYGIKPTLLYVPAVSIAYPAQDIYYDSRILLKYLPQASRAKLVIITVSYLSFEYIMEDSEAGSLTNFYYKYWEIPRQSSVRKITDHSALFLFGFQRSRDFLISGKVAGGEKIDESGGSDDQINTDYTKVNSGQIAIKRHEAGTNEKNIVFNHKYLEELLNALKRRNIRAVIVTTPCFHSYYDNINAERYARMQAEIKIIAQKYDLEYFNYFKDNRFIIEDFFDSDHLSTQGGEKFTNLINNEVIKKYFPPS